MTGDMGVGRICRRVFTRGFDGIGNMVNDENGKATYRSRPNSCVMVRLLFFVLLWYHFILEFCRVSRLNGCGS